ncbi:DUF4968 domain-containing protein [Anoxybacillus sp. MB8]|uniref:DUF4968 domain-containing protein n=1 Tax=Anoxybacillus sp. MB8 TaxID=2496850 RepID=UPI001F0A0050|nr:DUF4968 domain-containing protein [Anoxybacillus sp. MB8]
MLEDTSFAIRPVDQTDESERWQPIGHVQKIEGKKQIFAFTCERASGKIHFYRDDIVRVTIDPFDQKYVSVSPAVVAMHKHDTVNGCCKR